MAKCGRCGNQLKPADVACPFCHMPQRNAPRPQPAQPQPYQPAAPQPQPQPYQPAPQPQPYQPAPQPQPYQPAPTGSTPTPFSPANTGQRASILPGQSTLEGRVLAAQQEEASQNNPFKTATKVLGVIALLLSAPYWFALSARSGQVGAGVCGSLILIVSVPIILLVATISGRMARRGATGVLPSHMVRLKDVLIEVEDGATSQVAHVRLEKVGTDVMFAPQSEVRVTGRYKGTVLYASHVVVDTPRGAVTVRPKSDLGWRVAALLLGLMVFQMVGSLTALAG